LHHEAGEAFECTGYANGRIYLDENAFSGVDIDLKFAGLIDGRVEEGEKTLY
jgi:hypothetical protein